MLVVKMEYLLLSEVAEEDIEVRPDKAAMNYQTYTLSVRNKVARISSFVSKEIVCLCYCYYFIQMNYSEQNLVLLITVFDFNNKKVRDFYSIVLFLGIIF